MTEVDTNGTRSTVILAAGDFPKPNTFARACLDTAVRVVCCDHAADLYRHHTGRIPDVIIGDGDSIEQPTPNMIRIAEQDTNDLEKAIRYCQAQHWNHPLVLGATGKRDDHTLGNIFRAMAHGLEIVTNYGHFIPIISHTTLRLALNTPVSIFATPGTHITSIGLQWPLANVTFENFYCATLNRAIAEKVILCSDRRAFVYVSDSSNIRPQGEIALL